MLKTCVAIDSALALMLATFFAVPDRADAGAIAPKWFPGHYAKKREAALGNPGYAGYRISISWRDFEPRLGQFTFDTIVKQLDQAEADGKKVLIICTAYQRRRSGLGSRPERRSQRVRFTGKARR